MVILFLKWYTKSNTNTNTNAKLIKKKFSINPKTPIYYSKTKYNDQYDEDCFALYITKYVTLYYKFNTIQMSEVNQTANLSSTTTANSSPVVSYLFSNKNIIIIVLLVLLILALIGINIFAFVGNVVSNILMSVFSVVKSVLSMIGFTSGEIIKNSADIVADTAELGIDIAKGTTYSIGDLLINSNKPGIDSSKQISLSQAVGIPSFDSSSKFKPTPVKSSEAIVTPISSQKPKAGWCHVGDFEDSRGCVKVSEHDKCGSGQIFASKLKCLNPNK